VDRLLVPNTRLVSLLENGLVFCFLLTPLGMDGYFTGCCVQTGTVSVINCEQSKYEIFLINPL
jgi:hypothetical protein